MKLTVFFDEHLQFWVGVIEEETDGRLRAVKHFFGKEPKDAEILDFIHHDMQRLLGTTTQTLQTSPREQRRINPKRMSRIAAREVQQKGASTYAQQVISMEYEHRKLERKSDSKRLQEELKERKYALKVQKAKLKHRGK
ncbi:YjdF family protein [Paenibacillus sp. UNC451MF]|uniref:YjdF family protein n=1 Tax=Paenibacillus sp. UNC451MF TaxID=1449063 RepID=UPI00048D727C|nr:YjdF family protein [Paenibacillus sp. UNC451MF]